MSDNRFAVNILSILTGSASIDFEFHRDLVVPLHNTDPQIHGRMGFSNWYLTLVLRSVEPSNWIKNNKQ